MMVVIWVIRDAFKDMWEDLWTTLACNLIWYVANLLVVPGPPATLALIHYTNLLAHGEVADLGDFWNAFRHYWGPAWRWGGINLGIIAFLLSDMVLTGQINIGLWSPYLTGLYVALLAGWLVWQFFALPFLFEQEKMSMRQALRNGAVLIGNNLGFTTALIGLVLVILIAGTIAFMLSFAMGAVFVACTANHAVINRLETVRKTR